jgi:hypothetical protein
MPAAWVDWREADYPGASGITKRLLQHWRDAEQRDLNRRYFSANSKPLRH